MIQTKKKVVVIGGGTGTHTILTGLKRYRDEIDITAIVAMTDSGGSTGRLRDEFGYLPVGDVRMALAALAAEGDEHEALIRKLFLHRFVTNGDVSGHNFGNLFLMALTDILGSEDAAIQAASSVLRVCGTVLPVTKEKVDLVAEYDDGKTVIGEHEIDEPEKGASVRKIISLKTSSPAVLNEKAEEAIRNADLIVFGPGDLYTSILANCVVDGFKEALGESGAKMIYVSNLMTKVGQTTNMGMKDHVEELAKYCGREPDVVVANNTTLPGLLLMRYEADNEYPVCQDCESASFRILESDLLATEEIVRSKGDVLKRSLIRHDPSKLAEVIVKLMVE